MFMLDLVREQLGESTDASPAAEHAYFAGAKLADDEMRDAAAEDQKRRQAERQRQADAGRSNLGFGHDIAAGLMDPTADQLDALRRIVCHLVANHCREVIVYGAGWTDRERQQPVGDTGHYEPRHTTRSCRPSCSERSTSPTRCAGSRTSPHAGEPLSCSTPTA